MQNLFWYLWMADVCEGLAVVLSIVGSLIVMGGAMFSITSIACAGEKGMDDIRRIAFRWVFIGLAVLALGVVLPSKQTIYIHLGTSITTELADKAASGNIGSKALRLLEQKLDTALENVVEEVKGD